MLRRGDSDLDYTGYPKWIFKKKKFYGNLWDQSISAIEENCWYKKDISIEFDPYRSFVLDWLIVSDIVWLQLVCQGQATYYMLELEFNLCQLQTLMFNIVDIDQTMNHGDQSMKH